MQQEMENLPRLPLTKARRKGLWLPVVILGVLLLLIAYALIANTTNSFLGVFPWFVGTLSTCFIIGGCSALLTTRHMTGQRMADFASRGSFSALCTSLIAVGLMFVFLISNGIYTIYNPHLTYSRWALTPSWGLLVVMLFFVFVASCFHVLAAVLGGCLGGLVKGAFSRQRERSGA